MGSMEVGKRAFLSGALALGAGAVMAGRVSAQAAGPGAGAATVPVRRAKTTLLYKVPEGLPNALAGSPQGLWVGEQKAPGAANPTEKAMLLDWNSGKLLRTVVTQARNTSGMAYGEDCIWMCANMPPQGIFQTSMESKVISHRQIPLGPPSDGGGCHGAFYREGKLWLMSTRLRGIMRVDVKSWQPEFIIPAGQFTRWHDICWDNGTIWMVTGTASDLTKNQAGIAQFDATTGKLLQHVLFEPGSADPHGLELRNGVFYSCDAGIAPGFISTNLASNGYIFRIDIL